MLFKKTFLVLLATVTAMILIGGVILATQPTHELLNPIVKNVIPQEDISLYNPTVLEIPKLDINASIEHVGLLENGQMDAPKVYANTAWYKEGYRPGEKGNAVISGHVDTPRGVPAIFAQLNTLKPEDIVIVWEGNKFVIFKVYAVESYPVLAFPMDKVFGKTDDINLNLITCNGALVNGRYQERLVVFTRKI